ncbi:MAG: ParB/RepB/Spo0J family partition protein, partial [Desulfovibrionaceae bacterium]|nr:ParB/RepB/Spo0J family partition protein [Desulfovibrionaceae bacterium]
MGTQSLGRGLDTLLGPERAEDTSAESKEISISLLQPNPWQPRQDFREESLQELANSIRKQGIIQPLLVRQISDDSFQIIAGERRYRAAKIAGLSSVPVYVRNMNDEDVMTAALIENLQREDLNPLEEAQALKTLRDALDLTQEALAEKLGRSRSSVANALRLLQLSPKAQEDLQNGSLTPGHARCLLALSDEDLAESLRSYILENDPTVREVEDLISKWKKTGQAPWVAQEDPEAEKLPP